MTLAAPPKSGALYLAELIETGTNLPAYFFPPDGQQLPSYVVLPQSVSAGNFSGQLAFSMRVSAYASRVDPADTVDALESMLWDLWDALKGQTVAAWSSAGPYLEDQIGEARVVRQDHLVTMTYKRGR